MLFKGDDIMARYIFASTLPHIRDEAFIKRVKELQKAQSYNIISSFYLVNYKEKNISNFLKKLYITINQNMERKPLGKYKESEKYYYYINTNTGEITRLPSDLFGLVNKNK